METFYPNQRWTSEGEPELGVGIVKTASNGRVEIHFPLAGATRLYAAQTAPLRRVLFKPGDNIVDTRNRPMLIERVQLSGNLYQYFGQNRTISEADLGDVTIRHGVEDRLALGEVATPEEFALRRRTLDLDLRRRTSPVSGFVGGRIDLIPHQLYIAHEVSARYAPRVLLSDEVGLGKTIEACLILHRLLQSGRIARVLILVPESLVHQWFVEILRRFNLWFHLFDEERCMSLEESAPDGNPFLDDQLIICSTAFLAGSPKRARQARAAGWDMLVVDEAHHLAWSVGQASAEYQMVERLSRVAQGLLLLTATPEQLGLESHFARLRLLDPERYPDFDAFKNESQEQQAIADVVEALSAGRTLTAPEKKLLESLVGKDRLEKTAPGDESARDHLIEELLDQHGPGRVIFRNTRAAISGFPKRKAHLVSLQAPDDQTLWVERLSREFETDRALFLEKSEEPAFWFNEDPRVAWLVQQMKSLQPAKVLLICRTKEKVLALEQALSKRVSFKIGVFHEDLNIVQRDRNAAWFSEPKGARLLLCSEIGSEGRNFQFAHHLVLFDLPFHPELLEQRIGRLDRIGQTQDIELHVPYVAGSPQEVLVRWYHEGLNAFEQNLEGGNEVAQVFGERLLHTARSASSPEAGPALASLVVDTALFLQNLRTTLENGRDRLLEMNSFRPHAAEKLVAQIRAEDFDPVLETYMTDIFTHFGVEMEDLAARTFLLHPSQTHTEAFPSIPDEGFSITFDRKRALIREEISFLSWDHPLVIGAIDMVLGSGTGSASYGVLRGKGAPAMLLEALFVLETVGGQRLYVDRFLPQTPLRVVVDHAGRDVTALFPVETFLQHLLPGRMDDILDNEGFMEETLPEMIDTATELANGLSEPLIAAGLHQMRVRLNHEIARLKALQQKNKHVRPEEIRIAEQEQEELAALMRDARVRLDGLLLVRVG